MKPLLSVFLSLYCLVALAEDSRTRKEVEYGRTGEGPLLLNLHLPDGPGPFPWLLRFSSSREKPDELGRALLNAGYALAYAAYDVEGSGRVYPPWPQFAQALHRGILFLKANAAALSLDPDRAGIWGWSRGGTAAALAAATLWVEDLRDPELVGVNSALRVCVTLAGDFGFVPLELQGLDLQLHPRPGHNTDPRARVRVWLSPDMPPTLSFRGGADGSADDLRAFHGALETLGVPSRYHVMDGKGHGLGGASVASEIVDWLDTYLKPRKVPSRAPIEDLAALLAIGGYEQARRRHPEQTVRVDAAEADQLRQSVESRLHQDPAHWIGEFDDWQAVVAGDAGVDFRARVTDALREAGDAVRRWREESDRRLAETTVWPETLPVPAWAHGHGADGFGPWASLRLPGESELLLRFRPLSVGGWLAETETTQQVYVRIVDANPSYFGESPRHPVEMVNHTQAAACCQRLMEQVPGLRARLPLRAEWQSAFPPAGERGPLSAQTWNAANSGAATHEVASLAPNGKGFYDLLGNVFEWLGDERKERPQHYRFYAGGSFASRAERCDPDWIVAHNGANSTFYHGFRILLEP